MIILDPKLIKDIPQALRAKYDKLPKIKRGFKTQKSSIRKEGKAKQARKVENPIAKDEVNEKEIEYQISLKRKAASGRSPWAFPEQSNINIDYLDLQRSYVDDSFIQDDLEDDDDDILPPRQKRWQHKGPKPLTDIAKLIEMDWNTCEPDLKSSDIEGQIARCKERIEDNIMPDFFKSRLEGFEKQKSDMMTLRNSEPKGLSWPVVQRLDVLRRIESRLKNKENDTKNQLPNVQAIIAAYRKRSLEWTGNVTYWSKGKQLCQPRPFDWNEFDTINAAHNGHEGFWVEGMGVPGPRLIGAHMTVTADRTSGLIYYNIACRIPGRNWWTTFPFLYDTGASSMHIWKGDLEAMCGPDRSPVPCLGYSEVYGFDGGSQMRSVISIDVTLLDKIGRKVWPWTRVDCLIETTETVDTFRPRVDGGTLRNLMYYMTSPSVNHHLTIASSRLGMMLNAPSGSNRRDRALDMFARLNASTLVAPDIDLDQLSDPEALKMTRNTPAEPPAAW